MKEWTSVDADFPVEGELVAVISSDADGFCNLHAAVLKDDEWHIATVRDGMIYTTKPFDYTAEEVLYWSYLDEDIPQELVGV